MDIIGRLSIPTLNDDGSTIALPADWDEAQLRSEFALANREVEAIRAKAAEASMTADLAARLTLLQRYKGAIRDAVQGIVDARQMDVADLPTAATKKDNDGDGEPAGTPEPNTPTHGDEPWGDEPQPTGEPPAPPENPSHVPDNPSQPSQEGERVPVLAAMRAGDVIRDADGNTYQRISVAAQAGALSPMDVASAATAARADGRIPTVEPSDEPPVPLGRLHAPMLASLGATLSAGQVDSGGELHPRDVGQRLHRVAMSRSDAPVQVPLFRRDRLALVPDVERLPSADSVSAAQAEVIMAGQAAHRDALIAAFCGPGELQRDQRFLAPNTARPIAAALGPPIAVGIGIHEFFRELGMADLYAHFTANPSAKTGVGIWTETNQAAVSPTDPTTWKPIFLLPGCPTTLKVHAYFLYRAMRVAIEDSMSRPQYIENLTVLMEALLARLAEQALLETFDGWSFQRVMANGTGYGASLQLYYAIRNVLTWATTTTRVSRANYTLVVPDTLITLAEVDAYMRGEDPGQVSQVLANAGVNVLVTPDFGLEGNPMAPLPVNPYPGAADAGNGSAVPALPSVYTVRLVPLDDFAWGTAGIEDYGANTSPDLRRQNAVEFFGETAEIAYKRGGNPSFTLTLQGLLANGARPDMVAPFTYGAPVSYANNLPASTPKVAAGWPTSQVAT